MKHIPLRALASGAIAFGLVAGAAVAADAASTPSPPGQKGGEPTTVTLITGDVVTVRQGGSAGNRVSVTAADGGPADAHVIQSGEDLFVYPQSAMPFIAAGTLDKELFDVTALVADGYDDSHMSTLPLIVLYKDGDSSRRTDAVPTGATRSRLLTSVDGSALGEDRAQSGAFWSQVTGGNGAARSTGDTAFAAGIDSIWLDGKITASLAESTAQIGAPEVWAGGDTGQGVTVAVLDTGIDVAHPDFEGRLGATASFVPDEDITDRNGHGTHVASTVAGTGAASGGAERGVAPGATLAIGKVLSNAGSGFDSWAISGMEWAARDQHARIISMSLGSGPSDGHDPMSQAVDDLTAETGALFVIAAGNAGAENSIGSPGAATSALTVGAVDGSDDLASFSSGGPRLGDGAIKPEITAPGVNITAARSQFAPEGSGSYQSLSGTSMATPHVAGAAALLLQAHPDLTAQQLKDDLVSTSKATPQYTPFQAGNGRVDTVAATAATVVASGALSFDRTTSPESDTTTHAVTYTNLGDASVDLALEVHGPNVADGLFTLAAPTVTVAPHATATVDVTAHRSLSARGDTSAAEIRATSTDGAVVRTALGLAAVKHRVNFTLKDAHGNPTHGDIELLSEGRHDPDMLSVDDSGSGFVYLPEGTYSAMVFLQVPGSHGPHSRGLALFGDPDVSVKEDTALVFDAQKVRQIESTVPQESDDTYARLDYSRVLGGGLWRSFYEAGSYFDSFWTVPTDHDVSHGDFDFTARWRKEQPVLSVATATHAYTDVTRQRGATQLPAGSSDLPLVSAGKGTAADFAGVDAAGKAVVVRRTDDVWAGDVAAAAAAAGVKVLLVENNAPGGAEYDYSIGWNQPAPMEVALVSTDEGEKLNAEAAVPGATVKVVSRPSADYVYDVVQTYHNRIPVDVVKHETKNTLARIDEGFGTRAPKATGGEFRFDWLKSSTWGIGRTSNRPLKAARTDWVSVSDAYVWGQEAYVGGRIYDVDSRQGYRATSRNTENWFTAIQRPFVNNNYQAPRRDVYGMRVDVPGFGGGDHVGMAMDTAMQQTVALYQGDTKLAERNGAFVTADNLAPEARPYRFHVTTSQPAATNPLSSSTDTDWVFSSAAPAGDATEVLPMPQLEYTIDADAHGAVKNNSSVIVAAKQPVSAVGAGDLGAPSMDFSYDDGATWHKADVREGTHGQWTAKFSAPAGATFVSTRAGATDSKGNSITQTVIRAFGVRSK